jgi:uncharacterized protein with PQ loop repeat
MSDDRRDPRSVLNTSSSPPAATIKTPVRTGKGGFMLWTIVAILVILWLLGALGTVSIPILSGNTVHVLLVIVIIIVVIQLLQRRRL